MSEDQGLKTDTEFLIRLILDAYEMGRHDAMDDFAEDLCEDDEDYYEDEAEEDGA